MTKASRNGRTYRSTLTDLIIFQNRWWQHLLFWTAALMILLNLFKSSGAIEKIDMIYTFIFLVPLISIVYLNLYLAVPRILRKERYLLYALVFLLLMGGGALFLYLLFDRWIDWILPGYYFISYYSVPVLMLYTGSFLVLTTLLKLSRSWFMLLRLERVTTIQQLQSLQSQIHPHFLLNSLQTIYALSLEKASRTPEVILQLSEILKYTLYETGQPTVELEKEIGIIADYINMYRHRVDPDQTEIQLEVRGDPEGLLISPMLLIPFIENSFKHGMPGGGQKNRIEVLLEISGDRLHFRTQNQSGSSGRAEPDQPGKIGIQNTRQRLQLLYPGSHRLDIEAKGDTFTVNLFIDLIRA